MMDERKPQFTPGPWSAERFDDENHENPEFFAIWYDSGGSGCTLAERIGVEANASLIAAAPELYAELERAIPFLPVYLQDSACAALAKARGEK